METISTTKQTVRTWVPSGQYILGTTLPVSVKQHTWTRRTGLIVHYLDGTSCRSSYRTLREFEQAIKENREQYMRVA